MKGSGGTKSGGGGGSNEAPRLFNGDPDEWYDWDGNEAIDYIERTADMTLSEAEDTFNAIKHFTDDGQHAMRMAQRGEIDSWSDEALEAHMLEEFISKTPNYKGTTYRGVGLTEAQFSQLKKSGIYHPKGLTSWTTDKSTAGNFDYNPDGNAVNAIIRCKREQKGASIRFASKYDEREVVASGRNRYKVTKITKEGALHIIDVTPTNPGHIVDYGD